MSIAALLSKLGVCWRITVLFQSLVSRWCGQWYPIVTYSNADVAQSESHVFSFNHALGISTFVHDIDFGDNSNSPDALRVDLSGHLQTICGGQVCVCWTYSENDSSRIRHVSVCHGLCNLLNVLRLVRAGHWDSGNTWQVNKRKIWAGFGVNREHNWFINNIFALSAHFVCQKVNGLLYFIEVSEFFVRNFFKLAPRLRSWSVV